MKPINLPLSYFTEVYVDGNASTIEARIAEAIKLIKSDYEFLLIENQFVCRNEIELKAFLSKNGIL